MRQDCWEIPAELSAAWILGLGFRFPFYRKLLKSSRFKLQALAGALILVSVPRAFFLAPKPRLLVILDLDETLLHASLCDSTAFGDVPTEALSWLPSRLWQPQVDFQAAGKGLVLGLGEELPLFVSLRPGAQKFISWLKSKADIE